MLHRANSAATCARRQHMKRRGGRSCFHRRHASRPLSDHGAASRKAPELQRSGRGDRLRSANLRLTTRGTVQDFDYVIIGAGSAGCAIARRLSDDPKVRVLLLEAGPPAKGFWAKAPAGMARLFKDTRYNWSYFTEPV